MLTNARQILISEIVLSKDADEEEVTALIDGIIGGERASNRTLLFLYIKYRIKYKNPG